MTRKTITMDGRKVPVGNARNLLDVARQAGIDIPTFCYHSELSVYGACRLQELSRRLGVDELRFKPTVRKQPLDRSSPSLVRDPNKCILCGDCVRACRELQGAARNPVAGDVAFR